MSVKSHVRASVNRLLRPLGYELVRKVSTDRDSYPVSQQMKAQAIANSLPAMQKVAAFFGGPAGQDVRGVVEQFFNLYFSSSLRQGYGSSGLNALLTLYVAGQTLDADVVVESGTFEGFGSWMLRQACPHADMHCFDLSFENLLYRSSTIHYHPYDWASRPLNFNITGRSLGFFDDHVNQSKRLAEAAERGLKWLVFDDNVPWHALHRDGLPPVPTVDMVCDDVLADGAELDWVSATRVMHYARDLASDIKVRGLIKRYQRVDNLHDASGYPSTPMALVELA